MEPERMYTGFFHGAGESVRYTVRGAFDYFSIIGQEVKHFLRKLDFSPRFLRLGGIFRCTTRRADHQKTRSP